MAIQSNDTVHSYADSIVSASNSVSSATGTKDDGNVYQGQKGMSANIDGDKNAGEQAKERASTPWNSCRVPDDRCFDCRIYQ